MPLPKLCRLGYGAMNLTPNGKDAVPDEQAFAALRTAFEACQADEKLLLDTGDFYGPRGGGGDVDNPTANLRLLARFFAAHPELANRSFVSVKGGLRPDMSPNADPAFLRQGLSKIAALLGRKPDLFQMARVDRSVPIEETMRVLAGCVDEGLCGCIGLSEVSASTIRRAHAVHSIALVEVEYSLLSVNIARNGVLETCRELSVPIAAYCPLGRGLLSGGIRSTEDLPKGDRRLQLDRFAPDALAHNLKLVDEVSKLAEAKQCSNVQLALAWLLAQGGIIPIPGSTRPAGVAECNAALDIVVSSPELEHLRSLADKPDAVRGGRYNAHAAKHLEG